MSSLYCGVQSYPDGPRQDAVRRKWHVLFKGCTKSRRIRRRLGHLGSSLRASREAVVRGVTSLGKDQAIAGETCLASSAYSWCAQPLHDLLNPTI
jgi:hypothetical protein